MVIKAILGDITEEQVERIKCMESLYDSVREMIETNPSELHLHREMISLLQEYYEGPLWKKDFEADEAGQLPADLKRGVLSEDGLYNLLESVSDYGII